MWQRSLFVFLFIGLLSIVPGCDSEYECGSDVSTAGTQCDGMDEYAVKVIVTSSGLNQIDFSFGYCSDKDQPQDCADWHQSVVKNNGSTVTWNGIVKSTGSMRFNSSFFVNSDSSPDHWLCEGYGNPTMTATVQVYIEEEYLGDGGVWGVPYSTGCSAALDIDKLIADYYRN
jgi:hypothetical protein